MIARLPTAVADAVIADFVTMKDGTQIHQTGLAHGVRALSAKAAGSPRVDAVRFVLPNPLAENPDQR